MYININDASQLWEVESIADASLTAKESLPILSVLKSNLMTIFMRKSQHAKAQIKGSKRNNLNVLLNHHRNIVIAVNKIKT